MILCACNKLLEFCKFYEVSRPIGTKSRSISGSEMPMLLENASKLFSECWILAFSREINVCGISVDAVYLRGRTGSSDFSMKKHVEFMIR